jgi:hypothetical protein
MCHPAMDGSIDVGFRLVIVPEVRFGIRTSILGKKD